MGSLLKIRRHWKIFNAKYFYGFIQGHEWLSGEQLSKLSAILNGQGAGDDLVIKQYEDKFATLIGKGSCISFLSGRMAFYVLMQALGIGEGDEVILPGFTCAVMPNAICRLGAIPVFADISTETLGSDAASIEKKITARTKLIAVQHSFGIPCCIEEIVALGKKKGIKVIEDSAISLGSSRDGIKVGDWADASIFSTDHTKPLNTLIGGLLYTRDKDLANKILKIVEKIPSLSKEHQQRLHQQLLYEREHYKPQRYGRSLIKEKIWYRLCRIFKSHGPLLESDYEKDFSQKDYPYPARMPAFLAQLGIYELERWPSQSKQRQHLLKEYLTMMKEAGWDKYVPKAYRDEKNDIIPLRFAFCLPFADKMSWQDFFAVEHRWFQSTVVCSSDPAVWGYEKNSCPKAEEATKSIVNWPCVVLDNFQEELISKLRNAIRGV